MKGTRWKYVTAALFLLLEPGLLRLPAQSFSATPEKHRLLAVFAHPDDETMAGTLLAHYARRPGVGVYLVIVTNGEKGVMPHTKVPAGEQLAAVRIEEAECACRTLGAHAPILLDMPDGGLNNTRVLAELASRLKKTFADVRPDAIVTWGPEGGYGHPDHRLVSSVVTQVVQETGTPQLFYAALPASRMPQSTSELRFPAAFAATADLYLDTRVAVSQEDQAAARKSLSCHESQFTPQTIERIRNLSEKINGDTAYLRSWFHDKTRMDVFD
jgi:LmbE family N-acetylglucosaminyl deacetylase